MAITETALTAADLASYNAGFPLFCAHNLLRDATSVQWQYPIDYEDTTDYTDSDKPTSWLSDGFLHKASGATVSSATSLVIDFGSAVTYDTVAVFYEVGTLSYLSGSTQNVIAATASDFSDATTIYTDANEPGVSGDRWVYPALNSALDGVPKSITARYMRIELNSDAEALWPSEVFIGVRCQMQSHASMPVQRQAQDRAAYETTSDNGITIRHGKYFGRTTINERYIVTGATKKAEVLTVLQADDEPVLYCAAAKTALAEQEATLATSSIVLLTGMIATDVRAVPEVETSAQYDADIRLVEQGPPFFYGTRTNA